MIHVWLPELSSEGGIQAYSRSLLSALNEIAPLTRTVVLIKNDVSVNLEDATYLRSICFGAWPARFRTVPFALALLILAMRDRPALIIVGHLHFVKVAVLLKRLFRIPFWVVLYGMEIWSGKGVRLATVLELADRVISISEFTRKKLLQQTKLQPSQVCILPTTFQESRFTPKPKPGHLLHKLTLSKETKVILTVGRLAKSEGYKGYDKILESLPSVLNVIPDLRYIIVGRGDDEPRIRQMVQQLGLEQHVILAGYVPDQELVDFYNLCEVFAMPSKGEGFGIVYLEALACGRPVLAGNRDGAADALRQGRLGVLVDPEDTKAIASNLIKILQGSHPNDAIYRPEHLRNEVIAHYGFAQFKKILSDYLENSLAKQE